MIDLPHARRIFGACAICILAALPVRALADAATPVPSPSPAALSEIAHVVTPDRQDELARNSSRTVYVVSKQDMTVHGDISVADSLERVPGIVVERYGATGSLSNIYVRGAASDQTLVLLDGRPASGAQIGTLDLGSFSTNGVNRIEVVEGGGSTLYGSASIGGVINIITNGNRRGTPYVSVSGGAFGDRAISLEAGPLSFERRVAANDYGYYDPTTGSNQTRTNADFQLWNGRLSDGWQAGSIRLDGSAGASESNLGVPGPLGYLSTTSRQDTFIEDVRGSALHYAPQSRQTLELAASRETLNFYSASERSERLSVRERSQRRGRAPVQPAQRGGARPQQSRLRHRSHPRERARRCGQRGGGFRLAGLHADRPVRARVGQQRGRADHRRAARRTGRGPGRLAGSVARPDRAALNLADRQSELRERLPRSDGRGIWRIPVSRMRVSSPSARK